MSEETFNRHATYEADAWSIKRQVFNPCLGHFVVSEETFSRHATYDTDEWSLILSWPRHT